LNRTRDVLRTLIRLQKSQPANPDFMFYLAQAYDDAGQPAAAGRWFERTVAKDPLRTAAHFQLGVSWDKRKNFARAEKAMRRTLELDPRHSLALNYLGYSWAERDTNLNEALDFVQRALVEEPDNPAYRDSLGWVYFKLGRLPEAETALNQAAHEAEDPVVWMHLGDVRSRLGKTDEAVRAWQEGLLLAPRDKDLLKRLGEGGKPGSVTPTSAPRTQLKRIEGNFRQLQSWAGLADIHLRDGQRVMDGRGLFYFQRPDKFRLEILGPFFAPQALLIQAAKDARWWSAEGRGGTPLPDDERRRLDLLGEVLSGDLFHRFDDPAVTVSLAEGVVTYRAAFGELQIDPSRHTLLRVVIREGADAVRLTFGDHRDEAGVTLPGRVEAVDEKGGVALSLRFERGRVNAPLDPALFQPPAP
jgi:tetratricopeptide (TPR) repeat protein